MDAYVDALAAYTALINDSPLAGAGKPLSNGAVYGPRPRSPGSGAVAWLVWAATPWETSDGDLHTALISATVLGATEDNARKAAVALANWLRGFDGNPVPVPAEAAVLLAVEQVTGPSQLAIAEFAYLVDALINLQPA